MFKYGIYYLFCCQEVKQRIAKVKEAFNRKRSILCGPLGKELRKRLVKCFVWSVALYGAETWTLRWNKQKRLETFEMCVWRRMEHVKWTDKIQNAVVLEKSGRRKNNAGADKEEEKKLAGPLAKKELPAEGCCRRNGKREESLRQKKISDDIQHYDRWTV